MYENRSGPIEKENDDRRSKRSQQALIDALVELLAEKTYDAISIKEIVRKANVGRSTFYAHYQTKDALLRGGFERILDECLSHVEFNESERCLRVNIASLFHHAQGHYNLYRTLIWGSGFEILTNDEHHAMSNKLQQLLSKVLPKEQTTPVPLSVLCYSLSGSILLLLRWWLDNKMPYPPERMNDMFQKLVMPGIHSTLGMRPGV